MRKITDFIIEKRNWILGLFIILSIIAIIASQKVNINYDITKYLPSTSETRTGMDIMEKEFEEKESSFNLMFKGLSEERKDEIYEELKNINGVSTVDYEKNENYNKEDYTLYIIHVDDLEDSKIAKDVYKEIQEKYKDNETYTSGAIAERNTSILPAWIIILAIGCALVILIIMSESYIEPFLFLTSILMAVILNNGTNIFFDSVSNITSSISAILQLALSMDYSIMLIDRYRQEKEKEPNKVEAMKNALYNAFKSISSSSVTTIVGLIVLVLMSFKIGRDLGLVLAKGVLFSLICIFFVLPALILIFDKLIEKTKKKVPNIKLDKIGKIAYKCRYIAIPVFILAFVLSYLEKGNLNILYTEFESDKISTIFTENNQIAVIYKNEDEQEVSKHIKEVEETEKVEEVLAYGNTINEELRYDELNNKLQELGADVTVEDYLLQILYYNYYNQDENNTMTFNEFISFIKEDVYNNQNISEKLDNKTRENIDRLENFTNPNLFNKKINSSQIAKILEIDKGNIDDILIYYNSKNNNLKITLNEFIKFMKKDVLTNETYAKKIDDSAKANLNKLSSFTNSTTIQKKMTSEEMANIFGIDKNTIDLLYSYYISVNEIDTKLSLHEFSEFVLNDIMQNSEYSNLFDETMIKNIKILNTFSNKDIITKEMNSKELSDILGIEEKSIKQLLFLINLIQNSTESTPENLTQTDIKIAPNQFVKIILENSNNEKIKQFMSEDILKQLTLISNIMTSTINEQNYSYTELAQFIGIDVNLSKNIYTLYTIKNIGLQLTPQEFVNFILSHKDDDMLSSKLDKNIIKDLNLVQTVINSTLNSKKYSSNELSKLLGINEEDLKLLYGLYTSKYVNTNQKISLKEFVSFLENDVTKNAEYSSNFDDNSRKQITTINGIINSSINGTKYTKEEIFAILTTLTNELDKNIVDILYMYYGSINNYNIEWTLTVEKFVNYINDKILNDSRFNDFIDDELRKNITDSKTTIADAKKLLIGDNYSRIVINTKFEPESEETFNFIKNLNEKFGDGVYVIGNSPMAYEMSQTFNDELNFITIITMIAIFVVVAITFKSFIAPAILVLTIQCAVYITMGILSISGEGVYFIALLIVQSILMGATIDYAILYTSYYIEHRKTMDIKEAIINSYNKSINTILTSASILIIVTLIVGHFASAVAAKICKTISQGTLCSAILILVLLPAVIAAFDKLVIKRNKQ